MLYLRCLLFASVILYSTKPTLSKIVLPHKLRYLENMLNSEVVAKAAKLRQRMEANNIPESDKLWPALLGKYQGDYTKPSYNNNPFNYGFSRRSTGFRPLLT